MLLQALCIISQPTVNLNWSYSPETPNLGQIQQFLEPCDLEIWRMTLQNNGAPLLCYFKLCASFHTHWWILIWVTVRKRSIRVKIDDFFCRVTQKFLRMTLKTNRASLLCYFKLSVPFRTHWWIQIGVTVRKRPIWVKFDDFRAVRPWNLTDDLEKQKGTSPMLLQALCSILYPLVNLNWSYSPETPNLGEIWRFLELCDLEIWQLTFKNNRAPLLCFLKLCAAFHHHMWIQTWVTVRKRLSWVVTSVTLTFDLDLLHGPHFSRS